MEPKTNWYHDKDERTRVQSDEPSVVAGPTDFDKLVLRTVSPDAIKRINSTGGATHDVNYVLILFIVMIFLGLLSVVTSNSSSATLTPEQQASAIQKCTSWGGQVVYDSQGGYYDCSGAGN